MRHIAAMLLLVTIGAPPALAAVCELVCASAAHHASAAASQSAMDRCHDDQSEGPGPEISAGAQACHEMTEFPSEAMAAAGRDPQPALVAQPFAMAMVVPRIARPGWFRLSRPPDAGRALIPLRI